MSKQHAYKINILGLSQGKHRFSFLINDAFFDNFEYSPVKKGDLETEVVLEKSDRLIDVQFKIEGNIELICDRSLKPFKEEVIVTEQIIFKYAEEYEEINETLVHIRHDEALVGALVTDRNGFGRKMTREIIRPKGSDLPF